MSKIKNTGLDQYGAEAFEQRQFGTAGAEGVKFTAGVPAAETEMTPATHDVVRVYPYIAELQED